MIANSRTSDYDGYISFRLNLNGYYVMLPTNDKERAENNAIKSALMSFLVVLMKLERETRNEVNKGYAFCNLLNKMCRIEFSDTETENLALNKTRLKDIYIHVLNGTAIFNLSYYFIHLKMNAKAVVKMSSNAVYNKGQQV